MDNNEQYIPHRLSQFEKATTGILATVITAILLWVGISVSGQQVQQATIITTQTAQTVTLTKIQKAIDAAVPARNALITSNELLKQRVDIQDRDIKRLEVQVHELEEHH